jgi:hypothetical protein
MTHVEILTAAITKAVENGWRGADKWWEVFNSYGSIRFERRSAVSGPGDYCDIEKVLYDHEFARALWGDAEGTMPYVYEDGDEHYKRLKSWQYNLQQMVIAEDPVLYLAEHMR